MLQKLVTIDCDYQRNKDMPVKKHVWYYYFTKLKTRFEIHSDHLVTILRIIGVNRYCEHVAEIHASAISHQFCLSIRPCLKTHVWLRHAIYACRILSTIHWYRQLISQFGRHGAILFPIVNNQWTT